MPEIVVPNSASLQNLRHVLRTMEFFPRDPQGFELVFHASGFHIQPFVIAMLGAWAHHWRGRNVPISCRNADTPWIRYAIRMGLFDALGVAAPLEITQHEPTGRFIPLTMLTSRDDVKNFIADAVPLLHHQQQPAAVIYCLSELTRNVMEHAGGVPAFACAQYYARAGRVSIGVVDTGIGIKQSLAQSHVIDTDAAAIMAALRPGISGTATRMYGSSDNAGAGLFFTKAIAQMSSGFFALYSGSGAFRLRRPTKGMSSNIYADPSRDRHDLWSDLPSWPGTVLALDVASHVDERFDRVMSRIQTVYASQSPRRSRPKPRINFT